MKRFITRLSLFSLFAVITYFVCIILFGNYAPLTVRKNLIYTLDEGYENTYSRYKDLERTRNVDILIAGSSHAYRGYDPRIFHQRNINIFNLGSSTQTPVQTEYLLDKYLKQLNPKMVILDIYPRLFGSDGAESMIDLLENMPIDKGMVNVTCKVNDIRGYNLLIYCGYRQLLNLNKDLPERRIIGADTYIDGGYVQSYGAYTPSIDRTIGYTIQSKQMDAFNRILDKLKAANIKTVLVQSPMTHKGYLLQPNKEEMDSLLSKKGLYYNFNNILHLPDSLFYNDDHLNQSGVNLFNEKLMNLLNADSIGRN